MKRIQILLLALGLSGGGVVHGIEEQAYVSLLTGPINDIHDVAALFPKSVADVKERQAYTMTEIEKRLKAFFLVPNHERTFTNTALAYDRMVRVCKGAENALFAISDVHPDKSVRDACRCAELELKKFFGKAVVTQDLYTVFTSCISPSGIFAGEVLDVERAYYLQGVMKEFRRLGLHLSVEKIANVRILTNEIDEICAEFSKNIAEHGRSIVVSRDALAGVDDGYLDTLQQQENGLYVVPCTYPAQAKILRYCSVEATREAFYWAWTNRAYPENELVLHNMVEKRHALARLVGFESFAHYNIEDQMARTPEAVELFLRDLVGKVSAKADEERKNQHSDLPTDIMLNEYGDIDPWNSFYLEAWQSKKKVSCGILEVNNYFPLQTILPKIFGIFEQFLGLTFTVHTSEGFWHDDVIPVAIYKKDSLTPKGYIVFDLHPREKSIYAGCLPVASSIRTIKGALKSCPVLLLSTNFSQATKEKPALLSHEDIAVLFHELGHAMHCVFGESLTHRGSGYGEPFMCDYGEFPSQLFEQWPWDKKIMKMISEHYQTGESLPDALIDAIIALRQDGAGSRAKWRCHFSLLALQVFSADQKEDFQEINRKLHEELKFRSHFNDRSHWYAAASHFPWYGACVYSYLYSLVFAHDAFEKIKQDGLLNPEVGAMLCEKVLSKGTSIDPMGILKSFLGREPRQDAYLKSIGV